MTKACRRVLVGKVSQSSRGAPLDLPEHLLQNLSLSVLLLHDSHQPLCKSGRAILDHLSQYKKQLRALVNKFPGYNKVCSNCDSLRKLSNLPNRFLDSYSYACDCLQPPNHVRHGRLKLS